MSYQIYVTNDEPKTSTEVSATLLDLFQRYTQKEYGERFNPFNHQVEVFKLVGEEDKAVMLVAGTAAGKTLAIGVPLFYKLKLQTKPIKRILLMYPTIALMNDQRRVMDSLAELTGLEVGHIQGGMKRSKLVEALNKPVIVATPDALYWFFQKNVKYSGLLIYGLSLIDEFVLDEAHLFNGLTLQNVLHLKHRVTALADSLGRIPRWHILTATPTAELRKLAGQAKVVTGRSKCGDVEVTFLPPVDLTDPQKRSATLIHTVNEALDDGACKVLLVLNSAAGAHRLFEDMRSGQPSLPLELQLRFGTTSWGILHRWLIVEGMPEEIISTITNWVEHEGPFYLSDLQANSSATISTEALMAKTSQILQRLGRRIKDAAYAAGRESGSPNFIHTIEQQLRGQSKAIQTLWQMIWDDLPDAKADPAAVKEALNAHLTMMSNQLSQIWEGETLTVTAPNFTELTASLAKIGLSADLANVLVRQLQYSVELDEEAARPIHKSQAVLDKRPIGLRWLGQHWLVKDSKQRQLLRERLEAALQQGQLNAETRHIALWGQSGTPAVIYTGQMSRRDREGLIETFDAMKRAVLVSTPAVEVGVDFKAEALVTEECDGNGFLQRFGRVGRTGQGAARVAVLLREGKTWERLLQDSQPQMSREAFARMIIDPDVPADPNRSLFPDRTYVTQSIYLDASHWLINQQMGRIGQKLNDVMFPDPTVADLAQQMEQADVPFAYGLRSTLPGVSLLGGGGSNPFYILSKVPDDQLISTESPFEVAQAQMGYTSFLYAKSRWRIEVDWPLTLSASQAMFYWLDSRWRIVTGYGIAESFIKGSDVLRRCRNDLSLMRQQLTSPHPRAQAIARLGDALNLLVTPQAKMILGQGDVFLKRRERESGVIAGLVKDRLGNPLVLPDQLWLYIMGDAAEIRKQLQTAELDTLSEIHYPYPQESDIILLDEVAGGCFYIYERLVSDAN